MKPLFTKKTWLLTRLLHPHMHVALRTSVYAGVPSVSAGELSVAAETVRATQVCADAFRERGHVNSSTRHNRLIGTPRKEGC